MNGPVGRNARKAERRLALREIEKEIGSRFRGFVPYMTSMFLYDLLNEVQTETHALRISILF
jgi:hypothetical protein